MKEKELEKHYEKRFNTILKEHCKLIMEDKKLSPIWKMNYLNKMSEILKIGNEKIYSEEELKRIEKEEMGK